MRKKWLISVSEHPDMRNTTLDNGRSLKQSFIGVSLFFVFLATLLVLIFAGTYFRGDRSNRISRIRHLNATSCCENPQNCLRMAEFLKITIFTDTNFREFCPKPRNPRKLMPIR